MSAIDVLNGILPRDLVQIVAEYTMHAQTRRLRRWFKKGARDWGQYTRIVSSGDDFLGDITLLMPTKGNDPYVYIGCMDGLFYQCPFTDFVKFAAMPPRCSWPNMWLPNSMLLVAEPLHAALAAVVASDREPLKEVHSPGQWDSYTD